MADDQGIVRAWNTSLETITGIGAGDAIGSRIWDIHQRLDNRFQGNSSAGEQLKSTILKLLREDGGDGRELAFETRFSHPGKAEISLQIKIMVLQLQGRCWLHTMIRDLTAFRRAEAALRESEERFRSFYENIPIGLYRTTPDGRTIMANPAMVRMLGMENFEDLAGRNLNEDAINVGYHRHHFIEEVESKGKITGMVQPLTIGKGGTIYIRESASVIRNREGQTLYYEGALEDITQQMLAENTIREERDRAQLYLDIAGVMLLVLDAGQRVSLINKKGLDLLGYREEEILGKNWFDLCVPEDIRGLYQERYRGIMEGRLMIRENRENAVLTKSGEIRLIAWENVILRDRQGTIAGTLSSGQDITDKRKIEDELKQAQVALAKKVEERTAALRFANEQLRVELGRRQEIEDRLSESEEKFKTLSEKSLVGIYIWQDQAFIYVNPAFCGMLGFTAEELAGMTFEDLVPAPERPLINRKLQRLLYGDVVSSHFNVRGLRKDGRVRHLEIHETRILLKNQPAVIGSVIDVTSSQRLERALKEKKAELETLNRNLEQRINEEIQKSRRQEQMLMHQSKLAAMGEMVGAIAHQWRQPLTSIGFIFQNIQTAFEFGKLDETYLHKAVHDGMDLIRFMSRTIDDFRNFFITSKVMEPFDVSQLIRESLSLLRPQLENNFIAVEFQPDPMPAVTINGYPNEFKQAVINIISNARAAILEKRAGPGGTDGEGLIRFQMNHQSSLLILRISNNGVLIPESIIERIFEPYFTTRQESGGTGLGLYMAKMIIERNMGGKIYAENIPDGACFIIELPKEGFI